MAVLNIDSVNQGFLIHGYRRNARNDMEKQKCVKCLQYFVVYFMKCEKNVREGK